MSSVEYLKNHRTPAFEIVTVEGVTYCTTPNGKNDFSEERASLIRLYTLLKAVMVKPKSIPAPEEPKPQKGKKKISVDTMSV